MVELRSHEWQVDLLYLTSRSSTLFAFVITSLSCIVECHIFSSTFLMLKKHFFFLFLEIIDIKWLSIKYPLGRSTNQMTLVHTEGLHIRMRITCWYVVPTCSSYADIPGILWCCSVQHVNGRYEYMMNRWQIITGLCWGCSFRACRNEKGLRKNCLLHLHLCHSHS